jgi:hypothetical protein
MHHLRIIMAACPPAACTRLQKAQRLLACPLPNLQTNGEYKATTGRSGLSRAKAGNCTSDWQSCSNSLFLCCFSNPTSELAQKMAVAILALCTVHLALHTLATNKNTNCKQAFASIVPVEHGLCRQQGLRLRLVAHSTQGPEAHGHVAATEHLCTGLHCPSKLPTPLCTGHDV